MVTALPTWVPPVSQPPAVTWDGLQRKKVIVPVGVGWPPTAEMVATSCWFATPIGFVEPPGVAVVLMGGVTQVLKLPLAKSFSVAVNTSDDRVSARKFVKQPPFDPSKVLRSIPVSTKVLEVWSVGDHGVVIADGFAIAHALSLLREPLQIDPLNDVSSTGDPVASLPVHGRRTRPECRHRWCSR